MMCSDPKHAPKQTPEHAPEHAPSDVARPQPVERDFQMRITADGSWYHEGGLIKRIALVKLFASVLDVDAQGQHWLRTPVEYGRIEVEDAPFIITALASTGQAQARHVSLTDHLDREHDLGPDTPLIFRSAAEQADNRPYLRLAGGLLARLSRPVWYELAGLADDEDEAGRPGLWSAGCFFPLS